MSFVHIMRLIWHQMVVCRNMVWQVCTHVEGVSNLFRVLCGSDWVYSPNHAADFLVVPNA